MHLIEALQENYDYLKRSAAFYTDKAKPFNSKTHFLLKKIEAYSFSESALDLFALKKYDVYSEYLDTNHGNPKGTSSGPLVFLAASLSRRIEKCVCEALEKNKLLS